IFRIGVAAEIGSLIDEPLTISIDHHAVRIALAIHAVHKIEVPEIRRMALPCRRMASRPLTVRLGANIERHTQTVAGVVARAANLRHFPARSQVTGTPFAVRLEATAGENHRTRMEVLLFALVQHAYAVHAAFAPQER